MDAESTVNTINSTGSQENSANVYSTNEGQWTDWTSTWRKAGTTNRPTRHVTMNGTITRGKKRGQSANVELDLTDREMMQMSMSHEHLNPVGPSSRMPSTRNNLLCGVFTGPHITLLSIASFPFILIGSFFISFYFGILTWQNIFNYYYDEKSIFYRITICPVLVLSLPLIIICFNVPIAIYAAFIQLSWSFEDWRIEVGSFEKGFYGWLCSAVGLEMCSPYTVVTLNETENNVFDSPTLEREQNTTTNFTQ